MELGEGGKASREVELFDLCSIAFFHLFRCCFPLLTSDDGPPDEGNGLAWFWVVELDSGHADDIIVIESAVVVKNDSSSSTPSSTLVVNG